MICLYKQLWVLIYFWYEVQVHMWHDYFTVHTHRVWLRPHSFIHSFKKKCMSWLIIYKKVSIISYSPPTWSTLYFDYVIRYMILYYKCVKFEIMSTSKLDLDLFVWQDFGLLLWFLICGFLSLFAFYKWLIPSKRFTTTTTIRLG